MIRTLRLAAALLGLAAAPAFAGNVDDIRVALPEIVELAEIQPGLQVVTRLDIEVFAVDGAYWLKHDGRWYTSRRPLEGFQGMDPRAVPAVLTRLPKGAYVDYRPTEGQLITQRRVTTELPQPATPRDPPPPVPVKAAEPKAPAAAPAPAPAPARAAPPPKAAPPPARKAPAKPAPKPKANAAG